MPVSSSTMRILCMLGSDVRKRGLRNHGKLDDEARSYRSVFFHANGPMMLLDDTVHDGQSQPGSALPGREIWQEEFFLEFASHAMARIRHGDLDRIAAGYQRG